MGLRKLFAALALASVSGTVTPAVAESPPRPLPKRTDVAEALRAIEASHDRHVALQMEIAAIPAPTFEERRRAERMAGEFRARGLKDVAIDRAGNVLGLRAGRTERIFAVSAHLDTVFAEDTVLEFRREGGRIYGPGIGDDSRGLVCLLAIAEALDEAEIRTEHTLLFVGTVGEEGVGNLRGVRHLFENGRFAGRIEAFVSLDGAGLDIVDGALGSRRWKVILTGPGGHSYNDFGRVNPAHALGRVISKILTLDVPEDGLTTCGVGRIGGGRSVNSIPEEAWMEVDLRSVDPDKLMALERRFLAAVEAGVSEENAFRSASGTRIEVEKTLIGDRPGGFNPRGSPLVEAAARATRAVGERPHRVTASTDANLPISLGIPAVTLGTGGDEGNVHSLGEWYDPSNAWLGPQRALLAILLYDASR